MSYKIEAKNEQKNNKFFFIFLENKLRRNRNWHSFHEIRGN